jgi:hypothetical protein
MWSGPRNISTALMRSFGSRADTVVCDEPLYAHYLLRTGREHPMADEIVRRHESDWRKVAAWLVGPLPEEKSVFYQKHMAHHLLPEIERDWLASLEHAFLIRELRDATSYGGGPIRRSRHGSARQLQLFGGCAVTACYPVADANDLLRSEGAAEALRAPRDPLAARC